MNVVITGSTKGIGRGMAREFCRRGHDVMISSRGADAVQQTVAELRSEFPGRKIAGTPGDVGDYAQMQRLWDETAAQLGSVDLWVNNAGRDGAKLPFDELPPEDFALTVQTNLTGLMNCNHVAIRSMKRQGHGRIFNMEGFGSDGRTLAKLGPYGATKYALRYFTKTMVKECTGTPVEVCYLSPGMVVTDLLVPPPDQRGESWEKTKKILNILADTVETVTPFLVDGMLNTKGNGAAVRWLTTGKILRRFAFARFSKRDLFGPVGA